MDERVDEPAGGGVPEARAGAERRGDGRGVRVRRTAVAGSEAGEEEVEDAAVVALPGSTRQLLHPWAVGCCACAHELYARSRSSTELERETASRS